MKFGKLRADEIEIRAAQVTEKGASLLLYKDARVDQRILDESVGSFNWRNSYRSIEGNLYCLVEIYDAEKGQWIGKENVGTESYTEAEKGQASDAFKRACFNWGIGRELYSAPFIWVPADKVEIDKTPKGKYALKSFAPRVSKIEYDANGNISDLEIENKGKNIFKRFIKAPAVEKKNAKSDDTIFDEIVDTLAALDDPKSIDSYAVEVAEKYVLSAELRKRIGGCFKARREELAK